MDAASGPIGLGIPLVASGGLMILMIIAHALGLTLISKLLRLQPDRLEEMNFNFQSIFLMCGITLALFALHTLEIWVFAAFYMLAGAMETLDGALYYSASAYATLGRTVEHFPDQLRLVGAAEALIGFLLIGWTTGFIISKTNKLLPD